MTSGGAHLGLAIAHPELWGPVIVFNCIWHKAAPRAAVLPVVPGEGQNAQAVGMDSGCPGVTQW